MCLLGADLVCIDGSYCSCTSPDSAWLQTQSVTAPHADWGLPRWPQPCGPTRPSTSKQNSGHWLLALGGPAHLHKHQCFHL